MLSTKMSDLLVISCSESSAAFYVPGKIKIPLPAESHQLIIISFYWSSLTSWSSRALNYLQFSVRLCSVMYLLFMPLCEFGCLQTRVSCLWCSGYCHCRLTLISLWVGISFMWTCVGSVAGQGPSTLLVGVSLFLSVIDTWQLIGCCSYLMWISFLSLLLCSFSSRTLISSAAPRGPTETSAVNFPVWWGQSLKQSRCLLV